VNEHHQNAYGLMPSPNIIAACLSQRTSRVQVGTMPHAQAMENMTLFAREVMPALRAEFA
jgi:hypothetical protein